MSACKSLQQEMQGVANMQVEPEKIWCFEQEQALAGIELVTTIRMTTVMDS